MKSKMPTTKGMYPKKTYNKVIYKNNNIDKNKTLYFKKI